LTWIRMALVIAVRSPVHGAADADATIYSDPEIARACPFARGRSQPACRFGSTTADLLAF
jgi:hypothetical protein